MNGRLIKAKFRPVSEARRIILLNYHGPVRYMYVIFNYLPSEVE